MLRKTCCVGREGLRFVEQVTFGQSYEITLDPNVQPVIRQVKLLCYVLGCRTHRHCLWLHEKCINIFCALAGIEKQHQRGATNDNQFGTRICLPEFVRESVERSLDVL